MLVRTSPRGTARAPLSRPWTPLPVSPTQLEHPIVEAPMGGGRSAPALAAAVTDVGGLRAEKLTLVAEQRAPVVSLTFGCPPADVAERLKGARASVRVTVTTAPEAVTAARHGLHAGSRGRHAGELVRRPSEQARDPLGEAAGRMASSG